MRRKIPGLSTVVAVVLIGLLSPSVSGQTMVPALPCNGCGGAPPPAHGYLLAGADGGVFAFGAAQYYGSMAGQRLQAPIVGIQTTFNGYWLLGEDRGVFAFGSAPFYGSKDSTYYPSCNDQPPGGGSCASCPPVSFNSSKSTNGQLAIPAAVGMTADNSEYEIADNSGDLFAYGGNQCSQAANFWSSPITAVTSSTANNGVWEVASDGGVFAMKGYNDSTTPFFGSLPGKGVNPAAPIIGIAATNDGQGYWLVGQDGGVYGFGDAPFFGSLPGISVKPAGAVVGMAPTLDGHGYWLVSADGGVYAFGDAQYLGGMAGQKLAGPIVGIAGS